MPEVCTGNLLKLFIILGRGSSYGLCVVLKNVQGIRLMFDRGIERPWSSVNADPGQPFRSGLVRVVEIHILNLRLT